MTTQHFLASLVGKVFKILPLFEDARCGKEVFLKGYIDSLLIELRGAFYTFPELVDSDKFVAVVNTINYFNAYLDDMSLTVCRREVLKAVNILKRLSGGE
nr:hypothetical protein [uncultured Ruminococcus sp.]